MKIKKITKTAACFCAVVLFFLASTDALSLAYYNKFADNYKSEIDAESDSREGLKIITYNLLAEYKGFGGSDPALRGDGVLDFLAREDAHILALQECSSRWQIILKRATDYKFLYSQGSFFFGVMTNLCYNSGELTLKAKGRRVFETGKDSRTRRMVWGIFEDGAGHTFGVISVHLSLCTDRKGQRDVSENLCQATEVVKVSRELGEEYCCPVIIAGDFNIKESGEGNNSSVFEYLKTALIYGKDGAKASYIHNFEVGYKPNDHIFYTNSLRVEEYIVYSEKSLENSSDHFPVMCRFSFEN